MSLFYPGHDKRMRRFGVGTVLGGLGMLIVIVGEALPQYTITHRLPWLLPLMGVVAVVLIVTCILLILSVQRELRRFRRGSRQDG